MRFIRTLCCLLLIALAWPAQAFERPFPENAKNGTLSITDYPQIEIDGKPRNLSGGARIWSPDNLTVVPNMLGSARYRVRYTEDLLGAVDRVWLLTADEVAALPPPPRRFFLFK